MTEGIFQPVRARAREVSPTDENNALLDIVEGVLDSKALMELVKEVMA